jgi:streptomycin 3"-adenylyltransferase
MPGIDSAIPEPGTPPGPVLAYAQLLAGRVADASGGRLQAVYLHGSAVLDGWTAARSDVDVLFVVADDLPDRPLDAVAGVLVSAGACSPGVGLECR